MLRLLIPTGSGYTWVEHNPPAPFPDEFDASVADDWSLSPAEA